MSRERPKGVIVHRSQLLRLLTAAVISASLLALAACGGGKSSTAADKSTSTPAAPAPTGPPIKFSVLYPKAGPNATPEVYDGAQAAAMAVNAAGGVAPKGGGPKRPIQLVACDADNTKDPSGPAQCAKTVVGQGIVADVGKYTLAGDEDDVFQKAGVAMLGNSPFSQQDLTSPLSFPLSGASATLVPATAAALQASGATKVGYLSLDIPAAHAAAAFIGPILKGGPKDLVATTLLPTDPSADPSAFFAKLAATKPDGVILGVPAGMMAQVVTGLRQAGYTGKFVATPFSLTKAAIKALGGDADGMLSVSDYASVATGGNAAIAQFNSEMAKYAPNADKDEFSLNSWLAVHQAAEVAATLPRIDAASFAKALNGRKVSLGAAPPFTLGKKDIFLPFPRVFRATVQYQVIKDGQIVPSGGAPYVDLNTLAAKQ